MAEGVVKDKTNEKLGLKTHITYGVSQFGLNCIGTAFAINALFFYSTVLKVDTLLFGAVALIGQMWDAISNPMMGYISDNTTWKSGRRRPYILLSGVPMGIAFFLIFSPPLLKSSWAILIYLLVTVLVMFTSRSAFETPYLALAPELTPDYDERTKLSAFKQFFGTLGDAQGALLPLILFNTLFHGDRRAANFTYGLIACIMVILFSMLTYWGTREKPNLSGRAAVSITESFKAASKNRPFLIFAFSSTVVQIGNNIVTYLVLFITQYWFLDATLADKFFGVFFVGCIVGSLVWAKLSNLLGKKWAYIMDMAGYGLLLSGIILLPQTAHMVAMVVMFFAGTFNVGLWVLSGTIYPDNIDWDEYQTGKRREGVYSGLWTLMYKAGIGVASLFIGLALKVIRFDANLPAQSAYTLTGLKVLFGPIACVFFLAGAIAFLAYPITRSKHEEIRRLIGEREEPLSSS
jgi:GPH family glycoside/pentoside/hexuronide:cation symporter